MTGESFLGGVTHDYYTGANSRQAFIFTCTNLARARAPFDAHSVSAHGESWRAHQTSRAPDGEDEAAGSHYMQ